MSKEYLEALRTIKIKCHPNSNPSPLVDEALDTVEKALKRLESIDNASSNEVMDCLFRIGHNHRMDYINGKHEEDYNILEQTLIKAQEMEKENAELKGQVNYLTKVGTEFQKILKIIKETKNIKVSFYENGSGKHYKLEFDRTRNQTITQEEFELLKRWLG